MTEQEWLECTDPTPMVAFLLDKTTDRKLRLFACACCRHIWHLLKDAQARIAVEVAELYSDGLTDKEALIEATKAVPMPEWPGSGPEIFNWRIVTSAIAADMTDPRTYVWLTAETSVSELTPALVATKWIGDGACFVSAPSQAGILHEIFGNPFRPVAFNPTWLIWNGGTVRKIAQSIVDERTFDRMPILADALEEAGCDNQGILDHCRLPGEHVRGCWVVDGVLNKE